MALMGRAKKTARGKPVGARSSGLTERSRGSAIVLRRARMKAARRKVAWKETCTQFFSRFGNEMYEPLVERQIIAQIIEEGPSGMKKILASGRVKFAMRRRYDSLLAAFDTYQKSGKLVIPQSFD